MIRHNRKRQPKRLELSTSISKLRAITTAVVMVSAFAALAAPSAFATHWELSEVRPAPTAKAPTKFTVATEETIFEPAHEAGGGGTTIICKKGLGKGSFTTARKGTMSLVYENCTWGMAKCSTAGAPSGVLETGTVKFLAVAEEHGTAGIFFNPGEKGGETSGTFLPQFHCGVLAAGPIEKSPYIKYPTGTKAKSFAVSWEKGGTVANEFGESIFGPPHWHNFMSEYEETKMVGTGTLKTTEPEQTIEFARVEKEI